MQEIFQDIIELDGVEAVLFVDEKGGPVFRWTGPSAPAGLAEASWESLIGAFPKLEEIELLFEKRRAYIVRAEAGFIVVVMGLFTPAAMVRLNCNIALPDVNRTVKKPKGLRRFLRR